MIEVTRVRSVSRKLQSAVQDGLLVGGDLPVDTMLGCPKFVFFKQKTGYEF